jgi:hypothetical protein
VTEPVATEAPTVPSTVDEPVPATPPDGTAAVPTDPGWRPSLLYGLWIWLGGLIVCTLVTAVAWLPFENVRDAPRNLSEVIQNWHRWDTTWYVIIAQSGYRYDPRAVVFFPLYPLLVRAADKVLPGDAFLAALVVSILTCYAALVIVHRLVTSLLGAELGRRATFYLIAFPTGFFLLAAYNESLFIALAAGSLYALRRQRWWLAGLLAGLTSATRLAGVLLAVVFLYEYLRQRRFSLRAVRPDLLWVGLSPTGVLAYAAYCWSAFHDPLYFQKQQAAWFRDGFSLPWTPVIQALQQIGHDPLLLSPTAIRNMINVACALGVLYMLGLALASNWELGADSSYLVLFAGMDILLPMLSPIHSDYPLSSLWRYALECVPVFMVLAKMGQRPIVDRLIMMTVLPLQGVMILTFVQNQFVA